MNQNTQSAFSCIYSPNVPELLKSLNISLAITTYQAGKVIFLSANSDNSMRQLPRDFERAMGMAIKDNKMAIAVKNELVVLSNAPSLAVNYPTKPNFYDSFWVPRASYYTGFVDIHDIDWDKNGKLWAVNTLFSSIDTIDDNYSFTPQWKPPFIKEYSSADFCHLNGMAMVNGMPKYVTMFGKTTTPKGWRDGVQTDGLIMDIETNEIVVDKLSMPHSPRWFDNNLYCLLSATGELIKVDIQHKTYEVITNLNGFVRGMAKCGDYVFIGLSKMRKTSSIFRDLPITKNEINCGVEIVHLPTGNRVGSISYLNSVEEIYDVQIVSNSIRPGILNNLNPIHKDALHTPSASFWAIKDGNKV